jgi:apolipoprotein N-acyltransferase
MLQIILERLSGFYLEKNRWWIALSAGAAYCLCLPPFNAGTHPLLWPFPFLSFIALAPLLAFARNPSRARAALHCYLFGFSASLGQYYWIAFVNPEGIWALIIVGSVLIAMFVCSVAFCREPCG